MSKKIDIVIVGLNFGCRIVENLVADGGHPSIRLAGVCDIDRSKAKAVSAEYGNIPVYETLDDVLADKSIPAIGLFTGPTGRASLLRRIINAGKDVITTKPFETDPDAAERIMKEAVQRNKAIHLNSPSPGISPDLAVIERWRTEFCLGRPVAARADVWANHREQADGLWYDDPEQCPAAPLTRLGIYLVNDLVRLLGKARRVCAFSTRLFTGRPTADNAQVSIEFENDALANVFASFCVQDGDNYKTGLTINFENGTIYRNAGPVRPSSGDSAELTVIKSDAGSFNRQVAGHALISKASGHYDWEGFAASVRKEPQAPTYCIDHIVEPLRIIRAMALSEKNGEIVRIAR